MSTIDWNTAVGLGILARRTIKDDCPPLAEHLKPGLKVLDVGCGPASITLDVARRIPPGTIVGVDHNVESVQGATKTAARLGQDNASFQAADATQLPFPDDSFDLVYSHALLEYLVDPVAGLGEQIRVVRSGGTVFAVGTGVSLRYPPCPTSERIQAAMSILRAADKGRRFNTDNGHKLFEQLTKAGLSDIGVTGYLHPRSSGHPGSRYFDEFKEPGVFLDRHGPFADTLAYLKQQGELDDATIDQAIAELRAWRVHPYATKIGFRVVGVGRKP